MGILAELQRAGALIALAEMDKKPSTEVDKIKAAYKAGDDDTVTGVKAACPYFVDSKAYAEGNKDVNSYKVCCEMVDYCSFYVQTWFYLVCGGVGLLLIIILIVVSCCCCCKRRGGGGKDAESIETSDATKNEDY